uniref:Uncharacterized protein n=1 Tax=Anguilla anguilla TaxID=7936 RepID=A0A0E9SW25_ANGAN
MNHLWSLSTLCSVSSFLDRRARHHFVVLLQMEEWNSLN